MRNRSYALINLLGLSIGLACCILIVMSVSYDLSFDRHHEKADHIVRILRETHAPGTESRFIGRTPGILAPTLAEEFPEIQEAARILPRPVWVRHEDQGFNHRTCLVEPNLFDVFTLPFVWGDPELAAATPNGIVLTQNMAQIHFGDGNPLGRTLTIEDRLFGDDYTVAGVLEDIPQSSHFRFDSLIFRVGPHEILQRIWTDWMTNPSHTGVALTYLLLREGADPSALEKKLPDFIRRYLGEDVPDFLTYHVQPLTEIYLHTRNVDHDAVTYGDVSTVYIFSSVAALILLIACINFMNLSAARSTTRLKEVGLRKVVGARRGQLIRQFLSESVLMALLALVIAIAIVQIALPSFAEFAEKPLTLESHSNGGTFLGLVGIVVFVGLLAGSYPAFLLSGFLPTEVMKGSLRFGGGGARFRQVLVVFQFALSTVLIVGALVINDQLSFIRDKKLGFDKEQILTLNLFRQDYDLIPRYKAVKQAFLQHPQVTHATASLSLPGMWTGTTVVRAEGADIEHRVNKVDIDEDFLDTFEIELIEGRNVSEDFSEDAPIGLVLNETAVRQLGLHNPIGQQIELVSQERKGTVIGVVNDFHQASLHQEIRPLVLQKWLPFFRQLSLKILPGNVPETLAAIEETRRKFLPDRPTQFAFLDADMGRMYRGEMRQGKVIQTFSLLAMFVACLGLLGLITFTAQQRTKEMGIRKTLGATARDIVSLLLSGFVKLVVVANVIAWPVAYLVMQDWLQDFAYRTELSIGTFLLSGFVALLIMVLTVAYRAMKTASVNPVQALRYE